MRTDRIMTERSRLGLSQHELAVKLGITKQAVSGYELGKIQPSIDILVAMAKVFGVTTDYLLGRD